MNDGLAVLVLAVIMIAVSCEQAYLLRQIKKALDYQSLETARQSEYLKTLSTHAEMIRRYLQHASRRNRAPKEVEDHDLYDELLAAVHQRTTAREDQP